MIKFNKDNDVLIAMRSAAWRRAKAELMTVMDTINTDTKYEVCIYKALFNRIEDFVVDFVDTMNEEDDSVPSNRQNANDSGSPGFKISINGKSEEIIPNHLSFDGKASSLQTRVKLIEWSGDRQPDSDCSHLHVIGKTPIGRFLIYWQRPIHDTSIVLYFIEESPIRLLSRTGEGTLDRFKQHCQQEYQSHILECLEPQEPPT